MSFLSFGCKRKDWCLGSWVEQQEQQNNAGGECRKNSNARLLRPPPSPPPYQYAVAWDTTVVEFFNGPLLRQRRGPRRWPELRLGVSFPGSFRYARDSKVAKEENKYIGWRGGGGEGEEETESLDLTGTTLIVRKKNRKIS